MIRGPPRYTRTATPFPYTTLCRSDRPFDRALPIGKSLTTGEELRRHAFPRPDLFLQMIGKAAGELEDGACGRVVADQFRRALPADFDAPEKIGLRPGDRKSTRLNSSH